MPGSYLSCRRKRQIVNAPSGNKRTFEGLFLWGRVVKVYDGDTVTIVAQHPSDKKAYDYSVRLAGIDTPEIKVPANHPDRELHKRAGEIVRDVLARRIPIGTVVIFEGTGEDKYSGRLLGKLHLHTKSIFGFGKREDLNQWLLDQGYAVPYEGKTKKGFSKSMLQQIVARNSTV